MYNSKFSIINRKIDFIETVPMAGNSNVDTFTFEFDSEWDGLTKTLVLINGTQPALANLIDDSANIPSSIYHDGILTFGVYGRNNEDEVVLSSLMYSMPIENGAYNLSGNPSNLPDKTTWDEYTDIMLALVAQGRITLEECQQVLASTESARDLAQGYMNDAKGYKEDTEGLKQDVIDIKNGFDQDVVEKTNTFNQNAIDKTSDFNSNATQKTNDFNSNATDKTTDFNSNATSKTTTFNSNATSKTNTFNTNATNKTTAFNNNYTEKVGEVNGIITDFKAYVETVDYNYNNLQNKPQTWNALIGGE